MNLLVWIIFGLIVGIIANAIDPAPSRGGIIGAVLLGIVGALVGGFLSSALIGVGISGFNLTSLVIAVLGSLLLLFVGKAARSI